MNYLNIQRGFREAGNDSGAREKTTHKMFELDLHKLHIAQKNKTKQNERLCNQVTAEITAPLDIISSNTSAGKIPD